MNKNFGGKLQNLIEALAYPLAIWNFFILFFEPLISSYLYIIQAQEWTAFSNLAFLVATLLVRLIFVSFEQHKYKTISDLLILVFGSVLLIYDAKFVIFFLFIRQVFFIARYFFLHAFEGAVYKRLMGNPPVTFLLSFAITILTGTLLLMLPSATVSHKMTPFINALFTSTSATCVTGLAVVDTGSYWSLFGQLVILGLIQIGGLGIMTISTAFAVLLGQRLNLKVENVMQNVMGESKSFDMFSLIKNVIFVTLVIEFIGALVLFGTFIKLHSPIKAMYYSVFHSVSSFCNAGFGLYPDSFSRFYSSLNVNMAVTLLIILGGLGFPVIVDLYNSLVGKSTRYSLSLHTKIVLSMTGVLLLFGTIMFFISEFAYTMKGMPLHLRVLCSWFQSVTCRTAGFNTIDQSQMSHASILVSIILMFIGASPGSTGGGVKTSTFALLLITIYSMIRGQSDLTLFKRKIATSNARQSTSLITLSMMFIFLIVFAVLLIDPFTMEETVFEAVSAFGTVGLSIGITPHLSMVSKFLIIILMYIGRVGPLTVLFALSQRKKAMHYTLPEERVTVG